MIDQWYDHDCDIPVQCTKDYADKEPKGERMLAAIHARKTKVIPLRRKWQLPAVAAVIVITVGAALIRL